MEVLKKDLLDVSSLGELVWQLDSYSSRPNKPIQNWAIRTRCSKILFLSLGLRKHTQI